MIDFEQYAPQRICLVQGTPRTCEEIVAAMQKSVPLVHVLEVPRLTLDHARSIASFAIEGNGTRRCMVVYFALFSPDAAQVLLKSLEEPDPDTTIIFITQYPYLVPQTVRSRVLLLSGSTYSEVEKPLTKAQAFLYIKDELSGESDDDAATRRAKAIAFLDRLERQLSQDKAKVHYVYEAKDMLFGSNMPTKYVAEYAATAVL